MCGIVGFFCRESVPDIKIFDMLFTNSEKRGQDGFGIWIGRKNESYSFISLDTYSKCRQEALDFVKKNISIGKLVLAISRAAPETEEMSSLQNMQPIMNCDCILVHNGAISDKIYQEVAKTGFKFTTGIDSETIIFSYILHNKNIKNCMEYVSAGSALLMYDAKMDRLYTAIDFKPLSHGYIRGIGYFLSSDNDAIGEVVKEITGCSRDGVNIWEDFYHHYLPGNFIRVTDLDSGVQREIPYSPRYIVGTTFDTNYNQDGTKKVHLSQ